MATFRVGKSILTYAVIGAGLRHGWLPPPLAGVPYGWGALGPQQLGDLESFEAAGWHFHQQPDLDWHAAEDINGGEIQAGLLAKHPSGRGLVILRNHLVVSLPEGVPPLTPDKDFNKVPLNRNVYDVRVPLPKSDLESAIVLRIEQFQEPEDSFNRDLVAEPLILYHLRNAGTLFSIGTSTPFRVKLDTIQNHWRQILLPEAWDAGVQGKKMGKGVQVAVIDLGFNPKDKQIEPNIAETAYVNDLGQVSNVIPPDDHGTMCAGLVGALLDGLSVNGAAPECSLMLLAVESVNSQVGVAKAIELCTTGINGTKADVITSSLGMTTYSWELSDELQKSIDAANPNGRGTLIVWADFDAHDPITPDSVEAYPGVLCVGQCDNGNNPISCGFGPGLDLVAPGVNVAGLTGTKNGSSCAAPQVAGVAALILAKRSGLKSDELAKLITDNCYRAPARGNVRTDDDGWGRLDAKAAVENA